MLTEDMLTINQDSTINQDPTIAPGNTITFHSDDGLTIGKLDWNDGTLRFAGNADESAKVFFRFLANHMGFEKAI